MISAPPDDATPDRPDVIRDQAAAQTLLGYVIDVGAAGEPPRVWLDIGAQHLNRNGLLHGGIMAMLLDSASGFAAAKGMSGDAMSPLVTVSLTTNFLASGRAGQRITATGHYTGGGRKIAYVSTDLRDDQDTLIATATGVFKSVPAERFK